MRPMLEQVMAALDASKDENSVAIPTSQILYASVQAEVSGTSTGTLKLQLSNDIVDPINPPQSPTNWSDIPSATVSISGAGVYIIPITSLCYQFIRVSFVHGNAASGNLTANLKLLGI